jgi:hypothetical protein
VAGRRFEDSIEIDAPAERSFEIAANPQLLPRIDPSASVRLISGDNWTDVGSRHHVTNRYPGGMVDSVHEITRYEPPHLVEERVTQWTSVMFGQTEVRSLGPDRSVLIIRGEIEWGSSLTELVSRFLEPLIAPARLRRSLRRAKAAIEAADDSWTSE